MLVASFTKAAAQEIGSRIDGDTSRKRRKPRKRREAQQDLGLEPEERYEKRVGTLHAIMYHLLDKPTIAEAKIPDWNEHCRHEHKLSGEISTSKLDDADWAPKHNNGDDLYLICQKMRARMTPMELWPTNARAFHSAWTGWKRGNGYTDFTDLIELGVTEEVAPPSGVRVAIMDEAQDFTRLELALVRSWSKDLETVVLAMDDDQTLYAFKGASPEALLDPPVPESNIRILSQSYRVPIKVHQRADAWIKRIKNRADKPYEPRPAVGEVSDLGVTTKHPYLLVNTIEKDLKDGQSVMVLASCSYMLTRLITALREKAIPFHNPYRQRRGDWNPLRQGTGSVGARLTAFIQRNPEVSGEGAQLHVWSARELVLWTEHLSAKVFAHRGVKTKLKELAKQKPSQLLIETEYFAEDQLAAIERGDLEWFKEMLLPSKRKSYDYAHAIALKDVEGLTKPPKVVIGTIHSVKGGEADSVYLFPDLSPEALTRMRSEKGRDEIRRVFYVGMTRARERLILCRGCSDRAVSWSW